MPITEKPSQKSERNWGVRRHEHRQTNRRDFNERVVKANTPMQIHVTDAGITPSFEGVACSNQAALTHPV